LQKIKILLGITGSIAAYKAAFLCRAFIKEEADVKVIMTHSAGQFISPLTFSTLSKHPVYIDIMDNNSWNNHVELGLWADAMIIAPATANTIARMANGISDNMLLACYLSAKCPVFIAPAMDLDMWKHPSTKRNLETLTEYGNHIIPVGHGELASGLVGDGRMAEPIDIQRFLKKHYEAKLSLTGKHFLITAGPTIEAIDPVRFIGNRSTGKMGISIAENLAMKGAKVDLVLGPTNLRPSIQSIEVHHVQSAEDMYNVSHKIFKKTDGAILAAAVADYKPKKYSDKKIKKKDHTGHLNLELERTEDIAASLGKIKTKDQILVGFALETNDEKVNALSKLTRKNFDFIVLNSLQDLGAGFGEGTNKVTIIYSKDKALEFDVKSKSEVADDIVKEIVGFFVGS